MKTPWFKFFPGDWRQCPELRGCSLAARGLWVDLMARAHQTDPYGHVLYGSIEEIALDVARPLPEVCHAMEELESRHVFTRHGPGDISSRRMTRDAHVSRERSKAGSEGARARWQPFAIAKVCDHVDGKTMPQNQKSESEVRSQKSDTPPSPSRGRGDSVRRALTRSDLDGTCLNTDRFLAAWLDWEAVHGKYKPKGLAAQITRIAAWGHERATAAVRYSIAQGSQGIFEERGGNGYHPQPAPAPLTPEEKQRRIKAENEAYASALAKQNGNGHAH